jgi:hypothetical protein
MKAIVLGLLGWALLGCKGKADQLQSLPAPSLTESADTFREDLIEFSKDAAGLTRAEPLDSSESLRPIPPPRIRKFKAAKSPATHPQRIDSSLSKDTLNLSRPFSETEISRYVQEHYRAAFTQLLTGDQRFEQTVEEGQVYSKDGAFALLKARRALSLGRIEEAMVQAELAAKRGSQIDPETRKAASRLRCEALDSIRRLRPSEEARAAASKAWLSHNLMYSSN